MSRLDQSVCVNFEIGDQSNQVSMSVEVQGTNREASNVVVG